MIVLAPMCVFLVAVRFARGKGAELLIGVAGIGWEGRGGSVCDFFCRFLPSTSRFSVPRAFASDNVQLL